MINRIYFITILSFLSLISNAQTVTDIDGNNYNTVTIGTQTWMQESLKTTRFNNGVDIPTTSLPIDNLPNLYYQWSYDQDTTNITTYGRLYTWNVAYSDDNVCPVGWLVPDNSDWETLSEFLGGESIAGGKMKEMGTTHWAETDSSVDNSSGFTGVGSGSRGNPSGFNNIDEIGSFWSSTPFGGVEAFPRGHVYSLAAENNTLTASVAVANNGKAIRCVKDVTSSIENSSFKNDIQIFPNPASDRVFISSEEIINYHLSIYNMLGNIVYKQKLSGKENSLEITFLPKGTYLIKLISEDYVASYSFIKQ